MQEISKMVAVPDKSLHQKEQKCHSMALVDSS